MKFVENKKSDYTLDIVCLVCPQHLVETDEKLKRMKTGQVLKLLTDYDAALEDIPSWCKRHGQEFIGMEEDADCYKLYIKKMK